VRFPYRVNLTPIPDSDELGIVLRPEIPITLMGPKGRVPTFGLVDTGSDITILPKRLADLLGILLLPSSEVQATVFGGAAVAMDVGEVTIRLEKDGEVRQWTDSVCFFDMAGDLSDQVAVLGHAGFLDYFTATFDGKDGHLTLVPNELLPETTDP
jgi:predicted aspartyl protease